jgi:hypothetical protein
VSFRHAALLAALLSCATASAQDAARDALATCVTRLTEAGDDTGDDVQWPKIREACPELEVALESSEYAPWLPDAWRERATTEQTFITLDGLLELERLLDAATIMRDVRTLNEDSLPEVLDGLNDVEGTHRITWWDRFLAWIRERVSQQQGSERGWLSEWLGELGQHQALLRALGYGLFAAIVLIAFGIVVNEMKVAGVFEPHLRRLKSPDARAAQSVPDETPQHSERLATLIDRILVALARERSVTLDSSATHRELVRAVPLQRDDDRTSFVRLVDCAERVRYAAVWPPSTEIDNAFDAGTRLLAAINDRSAGALT